jgi:serine/threonine-protein phosphatase 4 regulatory subunit 1
LRVELRIVQVPLDEAIQQAFVDELDGISQDPVYWVRKEACFALGALAKVVPDEVIQISLVRIIFCLVEFVSNLFAQLPLLKSLLVDPNDQVRHSVLFALPAILSRLSWVQRRQLALDTLIPMSRDESGEVRSRVFESLGEVIYTFHAQRHDNDMDVVSKEEDEGGGPPLELIEMFLGLTSLGGKGTPPPSGIPQTLSEDAYIDAARPLILAFNFPAVTLVLGQERWKDLRELYLTLTRNALIDVRRTLSASIGELARIIGSDNSGTDLVDVWCRLAGSEEEEVRMRLVECLQVFLEVLDQEAREVVIRAVIDHWELGTWRGWREREGIAKCLTSLIRLAAGTQGALDSTRIILRLVLCDGVSAVREAGVAAVFFDPPHRLCPH